MTAQTAIASPPPAPLPPYMTVDEFIEWPGDGTGTRYELIDGVLRAMAPASDGHNQLVSNATVLLGLHLREHRPHCRVVTAPGIQPRVRASWNFRIPDLAVTCTRGREGDVMTPDPILILEVLSPGNKQQTYENLRAYATIPSVREIVAVESTAIRAELLTRDGAGDWPPDPHVLEGAEAVLRLASIEAEIPLVELYRNMWLDPEAGSQKPEA